ncbi:UNKNOWN [Stylonychia lemnae]|uniref:Uncharacterized protein n=1 Tax=Stylonychia lemnae TaxID=5949 RepID=A0A078B0V0_STYLE|nr:UNKNOWN [Stylonychia lemnae]|eukprot:CDW86982.1 UNKNOWN [Stylonychia lemnae]
MEISSELERVLSNDQTSAPQLQTSKNSGSGRYDIERDILNEMKEFTEKQKWDDSMSNDSNLDEGPDDLENTGQHLQYLSTKALSRKRSQNKKNLNLHLIQSRNSNKVENLTCEELFIKMKKEMIKLCNDPFNIEDMIISDSYVYFKIGRFFKFFAYHFLYFFITGPLTFIFLLPFENLTFQRNMGFYGFSTSSFFQTFHWLFLNIAFYSNLILDKDEILEPVEILMALIVTLMRCFIVAIRYATTTDSRIQLQSEKIFTQDENSNEFLGVGWRDIRPNQLDGEIKHSMIRNEVENGLFHFKFLVKINEEYLQRFSDYDYHKNKEYDFELEKKKVNFYVNLLVQASQKITLRSSGRNSIVAPSPKIINEKNKFFEEKHSFLEIPEKADLYRVTSGRLFLKELLLSSKVLTKILSKNIIMIVSLIHALLPFVINLLNTLNSEHIDEIQFKKYYSPLFWVYTILLFITNFLIYYVNLVFLEIGVIDMKRKKFTMKLMEAILEPNRFKLKKYEKVFPLLNYFDPQTLLSWMDMRIMILDVGRRFTIRIELYASVYLIVYSAFGAFYLCWFFEVLDFKFSTPLVVMGAFELLNFFYFIYCMFYTGAIINEITTKQILRVSELRNVLERLIVDWDRIMSPVQIKCNNLLNKTFKDAQLYFQYIHQDFGQKHCMRILNRSMDVLEIIQDRLDKEQLYNPIRILGIPLNKTIMQAINTSLLSLAAAMTNKKTGILQ